MEKKLITISLKFGKKELITKMTKEVAEKIAKDGDKVILKYALKELLNK